MLPLPGGRGADNFPAARSPASFVGERVEPRRGSRRPDRFVRLAAFQWLKRQADQRGEVLPIDLLRQGFSLDGQRVPLMGPQGIFKPAMPSAPLSITTVPVVEGRGRPYEDEVGRDGFLRYRYRGTDPLHRENVGLRRAMELQLPLLYLFGTARGWYRPEWPVFIVHDDPPS